MPTKQQVLDRATALDRAVADAAERKLHGEVQRVQREQAPARRQLRSQLRPCLPDRLFGALVGEPEQKAGA